MNAIIVDYHIETSDRHEQLSQIVQDFVRDEGWQPLGPPLFVPGQPGVRDEYWAQALVQYEVAP